ncbi:hypothetical protein Tco_1499201 [Tanacetum coccineum]
MVPLTSHEGDRNYEEGLQTATGAAPCSQSMYRDPIELEDMYSYIPSLSIPEDLVPAEDEAPTPHYHHPFYLHYYDPKS